MLTTGFAEAAQPATREAAPRLPVPPTSQTILPVDVDVTALLELTSSDTRDALGVLEDDLVQITDGYDAVVASGGSSSQTFTQQLGRAAYEALRIAAIRYPSARHKRGINVVIFTERLAELRAGHVSTTNPIDNRHWTLPAP